jgi:hypothetical protein
LHLLGSGHPGACNYDLFVNLSREDRLTVELARQLEVLSPCQRPSPANRTCAGCRANGQPLPRPVDIIDKGPGIPAEVKSRIFDPFFTTKPVGEGTGLGLDTVYRIVHQHKGDVRVDSHPGETHFQVRLPIPQGA